MCVCVCVCVRARADRKREREKEKKVKRVNKVLRRVFPAQTEEGKKQCFFVNHGFISEDRPHNICNHCCQNERVFLIKRGRVNHVSFRRVVPFLQQLQRFRDIADGDDFHVWEYFVFPTEINHLSRLFHATDERTV